MIKQEHIDLNLIKSEPIDGNFSTSDIVSEFLGTAPIETTSHDQQEPMDQDDPPVVTTQGTVVSQTSWIAATVTNTTPSTSMQPCNNTNQLGTVTPTPVTTTAPTVKVVGIQQKDGQPTKMIHVQPSTPVSVNKQIYITGNAAASTSPSKVIAITGGKTNVSGRLIQSIGGPPRFQIMPNQAKIGPQTTLKPIAPRFTTSTATGQRPSAPGTQIQIISTAPRDGTQTNESTSGTSNTTMQQPRVLIQAVPTGHHGTTQLRAIAPNLGGLPPGAAIQFPVGTIFKDGVVYVPQQVQPGTSTAGGIQLSTVQINPGTAVNMASQQVNGVPEPLSPSRQRKPCNCTKSQCLKLYCDCFANGEFCSNCNCNNCSNNIEHDNERSKAIKACLERNPHAFHPKIGKGKGETERRHNKGCHCKRSGCLKNYCECYEAKILCTNLCKCTGCKNFEESPERKTLMHLADAAEVRVQQQNAAKTKLESQMEDLPSRAPILAHAGERLPFSFVTRDVVEATCRCLLLQASGAEKSNKSRIETQKLILEEFGNCLLKIIHTANKRTAC